MDNALSLIQAKIAEVEAKLAHLKVAEAELSKLAKSPSKFRVAAPTKKSKVTVATDANNDKPLTQRIRDVLRSSDGMTALQIIELLAVENRAVSFALQAMKRRGEAKNKDRVWSIAKRRGRPAAA